LCHIRFFVILIWKSITLPYLEKRSMALLLASYPESLTLSLGQHWRDENETGFRPSSINIWWETGSLHVTAELQDDVVYTSATAFNQRLWERGDTFEMFLRPPGSDGYLELHVAPGNYRMQLRFPSAETIRGLRDNTDSLDRYFVTENLFESETELTPEGWRVHARIPHPDVRSGAEWGFSFCRYDTGMDIIAPVLSSTSEHTPERLDFHDQSVWNTVQLS
jgi:hypothetical protein